jgi:hypothetical protein
MQITWKIEKLEVKHQEAGLSNIVVGANWRIEAIDEREESRQREYVFGQTKFGPPGQPFVDFNVLTEDFVLAWVFKTIGQEKKEQVEKEALDKLIAAQSPNVVIKPVPWA